MTALGRARIERNARLLAEPADHLKRTVKMRARFGMDRDDVGARLGEGLKIRIDGRDHEMHVERLLRPGPDALDEARPERDVRHEMPIHHIDMNPVASGVVDRADLLAEAGEIGRQNRWGDQDGPAHG